MKNEANEKGRLPAEIRKVQSIIRNISKKNFKNDIKKLRFVYVVITYFIGNNFFRFFFAFLPP